MFVGIAMLVSAANASIVTYEGTTVGDSTFSRPVGGFARLSTNGVEVAFSLATLNVSATGACSFVSTAGFDSFLMLLEMSCDPAAPLCHAAVASGKSDPRGGTMSRLDGSPPAPGLVRVG